MIIQDVLDKWEKAPIKSFSDEAIYEFQKDPNFFCHHSLWWHTRPELVDGEVGFHYGLNCRVKVHTNPAPLHTMGS